MSNLHRDLVTLCEDYHNFNIHIEILNAIQVLAESNDVQFHCIHSYSQRDAFLFIPYTAYRRIVPGPRYTVTYTELFSCYTSVIVVARIAARAACCPLSGAACRFCLQWPSRIDRAVHWPRGAKTSRAPEHRSLNYAQQTHRRGRNLIVSLTRAGGSDIARHLSKWRDVTNS